MSEYQLGLIAPQRIEAFRLEGDRDRRAQAGRQPRQAAHLDAARIVAIVRLLARRVVPAS